MNTTIFLVNKGDKLIKEKKVLAIVPARSGSKRLKGKNIKPLGGQPLIEWSINAALQSQYIDDVIVSTDDEYIAEIAISAGAKAPFLRPAVLASDDARSIDVVLHTIGWLEKNRSQQYEYVMLLQPTSPLRGACHIDEACELLKAKNADAIVSICEMEHSPLWSNTLKKNGSLENFLEPKYINVRGQDLPKYYRINGAIYLSKIDRLVEEERFFLSTNIYGYIMPQEDSVDIDTELDFLLAQTILEYKGKNEK